MQKMQYLTAIAALAAGLLAFGASSAPASAATATSVYLEMYSNVQANAQLSVKMLSGAAAYDAAWTVSTGAGAAMASNIEFNVTNTAGNALWVNATRVGTAAAVQDDTNGILKISNTGTMNCEVNVSIANATQACRLLRGATSYQQFTHAAQALGWSINNTAPWTVNTSYLPGGPETKLWVWENHSGCVSGQSQNTLYINGSCT